MIFKGKREVWLVLFCKSWHLPLIRLSLRICFCAHSSTAIRHCLMQSNANFRYWTAWRGWHADFRDCWVKYTDALLRCIVSTTLLPLGQTLKHKISRFYGFFESEEIIFNINFIFVTAVECNVVLTVNLCFCRQFGALGPGLYEYGWMGEIAGYYL